MDEDDELVSAPDERGFLDLTNRAWVNLDSRCWAFPFQLFTLDVSYNHIEELPPQIGDLVMLRYISLFMIHDDHRTHLSQHPFEYLHNRELRAAFNKLTYLPKEIG